MKKILSLLLAVFMVFALVGCGSKTVEEPNTTTGDEKKGITIGFVTDVGGIDDKSFNQTTYEGLTKFTGENTDSKVNYLQSNNDSDYVPNLSSFADEGVSLPKENPNLSEDVLAAVEAATAEIISGKTVSKTGVYGDTDSRVNGTYGAAQ